MYFLNFDGLRYFYSFLKSRFIQKSAANNFVRRISATDNSVTFYDGNQNELCKIIFDGSVSISGSALNELDYSDMDAIFDDDPKTTVTGGTTDITDSELGPVFNGDDNVTVDGGNDFSADDINDLFG